MRLLLILSTRLETIVHDLKELLMRAGGFQFLHRSNMPHCAYLIRYKLRGTRDPKAQFIDQQFTYFSRMTNQTYDRRFA